MVTPMKIERIKKELKQTDLWMKTGIPQWKISLIENGMPPKPEEKKKIAKALGLTESKLFPTERHISL